MKKSKLIAFAALVIVAMTALSCKKTAKSDPTQLFIQVTEIAASSAQVQISAAGEAPTMVRFFTATELSEIDFDLSDKDKVAAFATSHGTAVSLPYTMTVNALEPFMEYAVGAVSFDAGMKVTDAIATSFQTAAPDNAINEDGDGAGSVTDRTL